MKRKTMFSVALVAGIAVAFVWENNALTKLRLENESLRTKREAADNLAGENRDLEKLRTAAPLAPMSRSEIEELLRLRNEVGLLRIQKQEVEKLRTENQRLVADLKSGRIAPRKLADLEGFVARDKWTHAGFATPEAAVQSFLLAISTANVEQFIQCMTPEAANDLQNEINQDPERFRKHFMEEDNPFRKVVGFRIAERRITSEDKAWVGIQVAADGEVMPIPLRRVGNEWKLDQ